MIGDIIVIAVVDVRGDKVRLGIDAPTDLPVHREEVYDAIQREHGRKRRLVTKHVLVEPDGEGFKVHGYNSRDDAHAALEFRPECVYAGTYAFDCSVFDGVGNGDG